MRKTSHARAAPYRHSPPIRAGEKEKKNTNTKNNLEVPCALACPHGALRPGQRVHAPAAARWPCRLTRQPRKRKVRGGRAAAGGGLGAGAPETRTRTSAEVPASPKTGCCAAHARLWPLLRGAKARMALDRPPAPRPRRRRRRPRAARRQLGDRRGKIFVTAVLFADANAWVIRRAKGRRLRAARAPGGRADPRGLPQRAAGAACRACWAQGRGLFRGRACNVALNLAAGLGTRAAAWRRRYGGSRAAAARGRGARGRGKLRCATEPRARARCAGSMDGGSRKTCRRLPTTYS